MDTTAPFESYQLGIDDIDEQHRVLFDHIENLDASIASGDRWLVVYQTLEMLERWAEVHFSVEESLMRICRFEDFEAHARQHATYLSEVRRMKQEALTKDISQKASRFLHAWLLQHVQVDDRKYAEHFRDISALCF